MQKAYTLDEIDRMRSAVEALTPGYGLSYWSSTNPETDALFRASNAQQQAALAAKVEGKLRTYMQAGISVEELERKAQDALQQRNPPSDR